MVIYVWVLDFASAAATAGEQMAQQVEREANKSKPIKQNMQNTLAQATRLASKAHRLAELRLGLSMGSIS